MGAERVLTDTPPATRRWRPLLSWTIKIAVSVGLLYVLLSRADLHRLWATARTASVAWLAAALVLYFGMILVSAWRWGLLLGAQHLDVPYRRLTASFLVATFFNNFLPSNIGGDVIRIADTAPDAGSKTLATTVVLLDRGIGLFGLVFVAAIGASLAAHLSRGAEPVSPVVLWAGFASAVVIASPFLLAPDRIARLLRPLHAIHQEWFEERINRFTAALHKFRAAPHVLGACFGGAVLVQAVLIGFYTAIAHAIGLPLSVIHLAILIPVSLVVQMLPVSVNGLGVREAVFGFYFKKIGLPLDSAILLSFLGAALIMLFSVTGAVTYLTRPRR
jgi:uncharacterized protein (TIRG00374 family)